MNRLVGGQALLNLIPGPLPQILPAGSGPGLPIKTVHNRVGKVELARPVVQRMLGSQQVLLPQLRPDQIHRGQVIDGL